jgi:hypothetical protein
MRKLALVVSILLMLAGIGSYLQPRTVVQARPGFQSGQAGSPTPLSPDALDRLLAPIALYPDQLLAQMLLCAMDPAGVTALDQFLKSRPTLKGTDLQDAALKDYFEPSYVAMALFPQLVSSMAAQLDSTTRIGQAFAADKTAVFASIQRLRQQARDAGNLKSTPQQEVETQTTSTGQQVIVIEPANPQVVYVPQYNSQTVYVQPASTTVVVENNSADAAVAGMIGFTAGIAIGAAVNNNYYYGPYGWHGGAYMYNDAWDDYYDHREDAREDWMDHREDLVEERGDRREDLAEERGNRAGASQEQRTERQQNRQENRPESQAQRDQQRSGAQTAATSSTRTKGSGRLLRLLERAIGTRGEFARNEQPSQLARLAQRKRRRKTPVIRRPAAVGLLAAALAAQSLVITAQSVAQRTFATPEDAVRALIEAAKPGKVDDLLAIFGPEARELIASSDEATARQNREIFTVAATEGWRLGDQGANRKVLIVGNEGWPFPVPVVKNANSWRFDTAAGKEEVLVRRIGRNELAAIGTCRTYVVAQQHYAQRGHDGKPSGLFATAFTSDPGKQNGLYWPSARHEPRSPLGDLVAQAAQEGQQLGTNREQPSPFHGYHFKILTGQGAAARGGARSYLVNGEMSGGFALVAWPAQYDATGVMTFIVNQDGIVHEKDLGAQTGATVAAMTRYNPDASWRRVP